MPAQPSEHRLYRLALRSRSKGYSRLGRVPDRLLSAPIAHRGLHDAANGVEENSRAAFQAAIDHGFGIELDLQLSSDGEAMVFHDYSLRRLTGEFGPIQMQSADSLRQLDLLVGGEKLPDLAEILELVDGRAPLLIELKDQDGACGPNVGRLEKRVAELLSDYSGDAVVMSFNPHSMYEMCKLAPDVIRGMATCDFRSEFWPMLPRKRAAELAAVPDFEAAQCTFVSHEWHSLDDPRIIELKAAGAPVFCWTITNEEQEIKARRIADNVTFEGYIPSKPK